MLNASWRGASAGSVRANTVVKAARLAQVDHPFVAVEDRAGLELGGIGRGHRRLGHADRGKHLAGDQGREVAGAPVLVGIKMEHDRILQRMGAQGDHRMFGTPHHFVDVDVIHERHALAADRLGMPERP
jgi:hypothetical protein